MVNEPNVVEMGDAVKNLGWVLGLLVFIEDVPDGYFP